MKRFKKEVLELLEQNNFEADIQKIHKYDERKLVNALFSFLCSTDKKVKENAVNAMGEIVSKIAESDLESARIIMRRLMLNLNDESGGIGWGAPEAMGEIMARSKKLAEEYHKILISYTLGGGNELDFEELQKDVIAGLKRLSVVRPELVEEVQHLL
jgi:galactitol-specific phosphotransferase system IIB component